MKRLLIAGSLLISGMATEPVFATESAAVDRQSYRCEKLDGGQLDLSGARVTFEDTFEKHSITPADGSGPWYASVHGGFGGAKFLPPGGPGKGPFLFEDGHLVIRMEKIDGKWYSGIIQSVNKAGQGFSQQYGYFEMRAKFPAGLSNWPAFWLKTVNEYTDKTQPRGEIDVIEAYGGGGKNGYHASVHVWPPNIRNSETADMKHWGASCIQRIDSGLFDGEFHTYGADISPDWIQIYFDRKLIARFPMLPEFKKPLFPLVDLAYFAKDKRTDDQPSDMIVDYVRVWQRS